MFEMTETWDTYQREPHTGFETSTRNKMIYSGQFERRWSPKECFNIGHGDAEFVVFPAGFQSHLCIAFPHSSPFSPFWNGNVYSVP